MRWGRNDFGTTIGIKFRGPALEILGEIRSGNGGSRSSRCGSFGGRIVTGFGMDRSMVI